LSKKVPTVYVKLLDFYNQNTKFKSDYNKIKLSGILSEKIRIMASASAPLNTQTFNNWLNVTGYQLVERYGLSETGMCLSNSVEKSKKCISGTVGRPYADIHVRISALDENLNPCQSNPILVESNAYEDEIFANRDQTIVGELQIKGPIVFKEYLNQSERTCEAFTKDGWFKTGKKRNFYITRPIYGFQLF
jgi:long-subunit acyl-CoA synthetase (AMP-forming)